MHPYNAFSTFPSGKAQISLRYDVQPPRVVYKDQAHEPKFMVISVCSVCSSTGAAQPLNLPLTLELLYSNGGEVKNQGHLKLHKESTPSLQNGKACLKIRIDSVSKNHDNRDFMVRVAVDKLGSRDLGILPSTSQAITVRSKRSRDRKRSKPGTDPAVVMAIASWAKCAQDAMTSLMDSTQTCPSCLGSETHQSDCALQKITFAYNSIVAPLISKSVRESKSRSTSFSAKNSNKRRRVPLPPRRNPLHSRPESRTPPMLDVGATNEPFIPAYSNLMYSGAPHTPPTLFPRDETIATNH
jgi:hypothetical protein